MLGGLGELTEERGKSGVSGARVAAEPRGAAESAQCRVQRPGARPRPLPAGALLIPIPLGAPPPAYLHFPAGKTTARTVPSHRCFRPQVNPRVASILHLRQLRLQEVT